MGGVWTRICAYFRPKDTYSSISYSAHYERVGNTNEFKLHYKTTTNPCIPTKQREPFTSVVSNKPYTPTKRPISDFTQKTQCYTGPRCNIGFFV